MNSPLSGKEGSSLPVSPGQTEHAKSQRSVRWTRTAALGTPLLILNCIWIANSEMKTGVTELTVSTIFMGALFLLFVLVGVNRLLERFAPRVAFTSPELLVLYLMLTMSSGAAGVGGLGFLLPFLGNVFWFGESYGWTSIHPHLPDWFAPRESRILGPLYMGNDTAFRPEYLQAWALPLLFWGGVLFAAMMMTLCLTSLLRRHWVDEERLPFPTSVLPVEMTRPGGDFFRNRLLWIGFGIPFTIQSLNSLNSIFPLVPGWPINHLRDMGMWFPDRPWNGVDAVLVGVHLSGVGLAFVAPLDMSFSMWAFYLIKKALNIVGVYMGWRDPGYGWEGNGADQFPWVNHIARGAWVVLGAITFWTARWHLRGAFHRAINGDPDGVDDGEMMSSRMAVGGLVGGFLLLCAASWALGAPFWVPLAYLTLYLILMTVLCRVVAEVGPPSVSLDYGTPAEILTGWAGTRAMSPAAKVHLASFAWFNVDYRGAPMLHQFTATKIASLSRLRLHPLTMVLIYSIAISIPAAILSDLQMYYANGAATGKVNSWRTDVGNEPWFLVQNWMDNPKDPSLISWWVSIVGGLLQSALYTLRTSIVGFPFHPAAFALICTFSMDAFWVDFFLGWFCKLLLLRYGGMKAYRAALPFFLGLILGDFTAGAGWSLVGTFMGLNLYRTFPT